MNNAFLDITFMIFTLGLLCRCIGYGLYEIKNESNFFGGVCTIVFSIASVVFSNIMVWIN